MLVEFVLLSLYFTSKCLLLRNMLLNLSLEFGGLLGDKENMSNSFLHYKCQYLPLACVTCRLIEFLDMNRVKVSLDKRDIHGPPNIYSLMGPHINEFVLSRVDSIDPDCVDIGIVIEFLEG